MSAAWLSWTAKAVSSTSDEVMPWCTKRDCGPMNSPEPGQEGDHVVLGHALDGVDLLDIGGGLGLERGHRLAPPSQIARAASFGMTPSSAMASQACASISNQMRKRFSGAQMAAICGLV